MERIARIVAFGFLTGALMVGSVLAGVVIDPLGTGSESPVDEATGIVDELVGTENDGDGGDTPAETSAGPVELSPADIPAVAASNPAVPALPDEKGFLVGAARASLYPAPEHFGGTAGQWETEDCTSIDDANLETDHVVPSMSDLKGWPAASPDCIYLGGFGIGPARVAKTVDDGGVWVRAIAVSNGDETFVYAIADTVGWFARYDSAVCTDCGVLDVRENVASDLGIDVGNVIVGSTHSHAGADTYGGWGGIPDWYRNQIRDAATAAVKQAVANLEAASIEVGEVHLRDRNGERRDSYRSNADTGATWLQATATDDGGVLATWSTYAGHPTIVSGPVLHADWPGAAARRFETEHPGSVGLLFEGGLGNVSISGAGSGSEDARAEATGIVMAEGVLADIADGGTVLEDNTMTAAAKVVTHPAMTNPGLTTLASAGLFDREFTPNTKGAGAPGVYHWSKRGEVSTAEGEDNDLGFEPSALNGCTSSGPTIITTAGAHRIGDFAVAFAPGEIFSNIAEVVKEEADRSAVTMVLGQTNDALGYIIQSFEFDTAANVATEYGTQTHEYEEVFSIDRCFGDHVLETILEATGSLGF